MKSILMACCLLPLLLTAQERKDEERPHVRQLATMATMLGWTKNDLGKWSSSVNSLPRYVHDYYFPVCEQIVKIDLTEVTYKGKKMFCVAKFLKSKYVRANRIMVEYPVDYWLFDLSRRDTVIGETATVQAATYNTMECGFFSGTLMATWKDIADDIIVHFENGLGLPGYFCIQSREDKKNNKWQFLMGSYNSQISEFTFNNCTAPGENNEMENGYYEVPTAAFAEFIGKIK